MQPMRARVRNNIITSNSKYINNCQRVYVIHTSTLVTVSTARASVCVMNALLAKTAISAHTDIIAIQSVDHVIVMLMVPMEMFVW
jgi:hypothetical protein